MIYVIEDDVGVRRALDLFFQSTSQCHKTFKNVSQCIDYFDTEAKTEPTLVKLDPTRDIFIIDFLLPTMNGHESAMALMAYFQVDSLNIILISGLSKHAIEDCLGGKLQYDFLQKPFNLEDLELLLNKQMVK